MHYVHFLRSVSRPTKKYVGMTEDVHARISKHNAGEVSSSSRWRPWELVTYIAVQPSEHAAKLEQYLKSGSGHAFAHRHLL